MKTKRWLEKNIPVRLGFMPLLSLGLLLGCGNSDGEKSSDQKAAIPSIQNEKASPANTTFGTKGEIEAYLGQINPHVQEVGRIQLLVDKNIGTSGKATGSNLAPAMKSAKPTLEAILDTLSNINPPPLLSSFHGKFKKLVALRISAYDTTIRGLELENESGDLSLYEKAETQLSEANKLIVQLNGEMGKIMQSLDSPQPEQAAKSQ